MYNEDVKRSLVKFSVIQCREKRLSHVLYCVFFLTKWNGMINHTVSPFRAFLNECQVSLTQLLDDDRHWRMIVTPLTN